MAGQERDLAGEALQTSFADDDTDSSTSANGTFSNENIDPDDSLSQRDEEVLAQSTAINAPEISPHISEDNSQYDDSKDKGKTPVRASLYTFHKSLPERGGASDVNLQSQVRATSPPSIPKNPGAPRLPVASSIGAVNRESLGGLILETCDQHRTRPSSSKFTSGIFDVESQDENHRTTSPKPCTNSRQFQKQEQEVELVRKSGSEPANPTSTTANQNASEGSEAQPFRPPQYGEPGWEKSADRPPRKLPIRFQDCLKRKYIFPWEKAKTWAGMEHLIQACFDHIIVLGPHVNAGHYDLLTTSLPSSASTDVGSETGPTDVPVQTEIPSGPPPPQDPTPPPTVPSTPAQQDSSIIILPELWEDIVEPGMSILMQMWRMDAPPPPATAPAPTPGPPLHPPSPPMFPGLAGGGGRGRGRGRGIGRGGGRGMVVPPPFGTPGWVLVEPPKPRGKTRKRQDGL
ncbi:uncharacterized protein F4807DRAFT_146833 [Annulohypoxylon truncatum]|uniref:uncharacterized protein n=1 Tax=Annulohypoxylon truncatum TaxID=327061 RepID=UPI002007DFD1|nr:uncharacterized protein F4807DRAFT_146833 [Annulohypoxylon truncatum]KAI1208693.1 hypothetical protein F4807DRAFT_146833 [Annulohypoxylon truncatum]